ncbi:Cystathionine gamma-lyase inhibitor [Fasciolopsis buskii]|uniref:cystathionine gamma-lyase n=1 Tax=Fasciolopsis buskii TaxID=27845 RepID=A0A8E0S5F6_9TREM|nr:Cystathionine gamma-lyase inhibitor [Fasciolopsis buski]
MVDFETTFADVSNSVAAYIAKHFRPFDQIETTVTHAGYEPRKLGDLGYPITAPISLATTFQQFTPGVAKYDYSRAGNFSRECLENCIAQLENGDHCSVFSSGLAALSALVQLLSCGDHIVAFDDLYGGSGRYLRTLASKANITFTMVDMRDEALFKTALQPNTRLVLVETPSNPLMRLVDIERVVKLVREYDKSILIAVDNTFMTPYFQRPLDYGADISWHSLTKYMNGHADVVMGAVVTKNNLNLHKQLVYLQLAGGAVPSPFDCYLCLRGIRTLAVRMHAHMRSALIVAMMLERHPNVERVIHPALTSHPQRELAEKQMRGFSGMVTVYLKCDYESTAEFVKNIRLFALAESLGGYESLIEIPSIMTHASVPKEIRERNQISDNMLRLSIGLEDTRDLVKALYDALDMLPSQRTS